MRAETLFFLFWFRVFDRQTEAKDSAESRKTFCVRKILAAQLAAEA
jgi:hypothetical protein